MTRNDRELRLCYEIVKQAFDAEEWDTLDKVSLLDALDEDWNYLFKKIRDEGWDALSDEEIIILYDWAEEKNLFIHTTPYCTTR